MMKIAVYKDFNHPNNPSLLIFYILEFEHLDYETVFIGEDHKWGHSEKHIDDIFI